MGTSAKIKIENVQYAELYKHWDGNPSSTLQWLEDFNKDFTLNRGEDPEYKFAQLVRSSTRDQEKYNLDDSKYTGWGIVAQDSIDTDYTYTLMTDGTVH